MPVVPCAKFAVQDGLVKVNQIMELQRGKKAWYLQMKSEYDGRDHRTIISRLLMIIKSIQLGSIIVVCSFLSYFTETMRRARPVYSGATHVCPTRCNPPESFIPVHVLLRRGFFNAEIYR